jgi:hypothetical protein
MSKNRGEAFPTPSEGHNGRAPLQDVESDDLEAGQQP